jgi:hypothetical protein
VSKKLVGLEDKIEELLVIKTQDSEITSLQKQNENNSCNICICHTDGEVHHPSGPSLQLLNKTVVDNCTIVSQDNGLNASISNNNNGVITLTSSNSSDYSADNSGSMQSMRQLNPVENAKTPAAISDDQVSTETSEGFIGVQRTRIRTKRFFLSGIAGNVTSETISDYLTGRGISPTLLQVFPSRRKGTVSTKVNVRVADVETITRDNFWPKFVVCKPWISKEKFHLKNNVENYEQH